MNRVARRACSSRSPRGEFVHRCTDCGGEVLVYALSDFIGANRRRPIPGLSEPLEDLLSVLGPQDPVKFCPGCVAFTAVVWGQFTD